MLRSACGEQAKRRCAVWGTTEPTRLKTDDLMLVVLAPLRPQQRNRI